MLLKPQTLAEYPPRHHGENCTDALEETEAAQDTDDGSGTDECSIIWDCGNVFGTRCLVDGSVQSLITGTTWCGGTGVACGRR